MSLLVTFLHARSVVTSHTTWKSGAASLSIAFLRTWSDQRWHSGSALEERRSVPHGLLEERRDVRLAIAIGSPSAHKLKGSKWLEDARENMITQ
jgi:hypothetical protein